MKIPLNIKYFYNFLSNKMQMVKLDEANLVNDLNTLSIGKIANQDMEIESKKMAEEQKLIAKLMKSFNYIYLNSQILQMIP